MSLSDRGRQGHRFSTHVLFAQVNLVRKRHPELRAGQALWNVTVELWPDIANPLRGTEVDPFYDDSKIGAFIMACAERAAR